MLRPSRLGKGDLKTLVPPIFKTFIFYHSFKDCKRKANRLDS